AESGQDDLVEQATVSSRGATLALCLDMLGEEPFGEFGDRRRFLAGHLVGGGVGAVLDHPEQLLGFGARGLRCPGRTVPADRQLAQCGTPAGADAVVHDVALRAAALHPDTEALQLSIPYDRFGA